MPLIGNLKAYERDRPGFLLSCAQNYGGVVRFSRNVTFVSDVGLVGELLLDGQRCLGRIQNFLFEEVNERNTAEWMTGRRESLKALRQLEPSLIERLSDAFTHEVLGQERRTLDINELMERVTRRVAARTCFGDLDLRDVESSAQELLDILFEISQTPLRHPAFLPAGRTRRAHASEARLRSVVRGRIDSKNLPPDCLAFHLRESVGDELAVRMLIGILLAGHGVPARSVAWIVYLLARHPAAASRVRDEIANLNGSLPGDLAGFAASTPYTWAVVKEALRMFPPTWLLGRRAERQLTLANYRVEQGHVLLFSSYVAGRDAHSFPSPEQFKPTRWIERDLESDLSVGAYFPFGGGARSCIGRRMAEYELLASTVLMLSWTEYGVLNTSNVVLDSRRSLVPKNLVLQLRASDDTHQPRTASPN